MKCENIEKCRKEWGYCGITGREQSEEIPRMLAGTLCWYSVKAYIFGATIKIEGG